MKFENTCRACLQDHSELLSIFDYYEEDVNLCNIIKDISNVEVVYGDNLPDTICEPCLEQLRQIQQFRAQLQYSDIILREYFTDTVFVKPNDDILNEEASKFLEGGDETDDNLENNGQKTSSVSSISKKVVIKLDTKEKTELKPNAVTIKFHPKKTLNKMTNNEKTVKEETKKGGVELGESKTNHIVTNVYPKQTFQNQKSVQELTQKMEYYEHKDSTDKFPQNKKSVQETKKKVKTTKMQPKKMIDELSEEEREDPEEIKNEDADKLNELKVQKDIGEDVDELEEIRKFLNPVGSSKESAENSCDDKTANQLESDKTVENNSEIKTEVITDNLDTKDEMKPLTNWDEIDPFTSDDEYFPDNTEDEKPRKRRKLGPKTRRNKTTCHVCNEDLLTPRKLTTHKRVAHSIMGNHECPKCGLTFRGIKMLRDHMINTHAIEIQEKFTCNICFKVYHSEKTWREHVKSHNIPATDSNTCTICNKLFLYPSLLTQHLKSHSTEKPYLCFYCGKGFRHQGQYDYHIREHMGDTPYKCSYCGKGFMSPGHLRIHMRKHTNERPYMCDLCGKGFRQICDLKSHRRVHLGIKPIECSVCKKKLSTTGQYTIHMRTHTGEKPFACPECDRCFATRSMVIKHRATHSTEKPFSCSICDKKFRHKYSVVGHMRMHQRDTKPRSKPPKIIVVSEKANRTHILVSKESDEEDDETII